MYVCIFNITNFNFLIKTKLKIFKFIRNLKSNCTIFIFHIKK